MTDYTSMTDEQINKAVADSLGLQWAIPPVASSTGGWQFSSVSDDADHLKDYCNDWGAMGPIIEGECIDLYFFANSVGGYNWSARDGRGEIYLECTDKNPKRAAAIFFLMMQEAKQ